MLQEIQHRGMDHRGKKIIPLDTYPGLVALGHNRLSVIDLSENGNQPFSYKNYSLIYNGEIYNYKDLKKELILNGYSFDSDSDTEVIIKLFDCFGFNAFSKLNGMFAIAIFDNLKHKIFLVRDRMGVKPISYYIEDGAFLFSSEIKSFFSFPNFQQNAPIDRTILANYFKFGYVNSFKSIYENVNKVENGTVLTFDIISQQITTTKYWVLKKNQASYFNNMKDASNSIHRILKSSISLRHVSDIPVGLFLSSGLDSNLVLAYSLKNGLKNIDTYTLKSVDFEENNLKYDKKVNRTFIETDLDSIWKDFKFLCSKFDEPFSDPATIGLYQLSKHASSYNKVILVGDGGDELLAGYSPYKLFSRIETDFKIKTLRFIYKPFKPFVELFFNFFLESKTALRLLYYHSVLSSSRLSEVDSVRSKYFDRFTKKLTKNCFEESTDFDESNPLLSYLNMKTSGELIHQLNYKTDVAGMLNTVEIREPLLDYRLFEAQQKFSKSLLTENVNKKESKFIFRKIMKEKLRFDITNIQKKGFHISLESAFVKNIVELDELILYHKSDLIDMNYVRKIWKKWKKGNANFLLITRIVSFIYWERKYNKLSVV